MKSILLLLALMGQSLFDNDSPIPKSTQAPLVTLELYNNGEKAPAQAQVQPTDCVKIVHVGDHTIGTGVLVNSPLNGRQYIITCNHVINGVKPTDDILFGNDNVYIVNKDFKLDIGILENASDNSVNGVNICADETIKVGDELYSIGGPQPITTIKHTVRLTDDTTIYTDGPYIAGRSGGGLFNKAGELVGIFHGVHKDTREQVYTRASKLVELLDPVQYTIKAYSLASCKFCQQMHAISSTENDKRIIWDWTYDTIPPEIMKRLTAGYMAPVLTTTINGSGQVTWPAKSGVYTIDQMYKFCQNVDAVPVAVERPVGSNIGDGAVGAISCKAYIEQLFTYYNTYLPQGTKATVKWNRSGNESFNLYGGKKSPLTTATVLGNDGGLSLQLTYPDNYTGTKLPVRELAFNYNANPTTGDMSFTIERILVHDLATLIDAKLASVGGEQPKGFVLMTLVSIVSVVRDIWLITHPTLDMYLGSVVSATTYNDPASNTIIIDFKDMPQARIVMLFSFKLSIKQIKITHKRIDIQFVGSRIVKHYGFDIK